MADDDAVDDAVIVLVRIATGMVAGVFTNRTTMRAWLAPQGTQAGRLYVRVNARVDPSYDGC